MSATLVTWPDLSDEFVVHPAIDHALSLYPLNIAGQASRVIRSFVGPVDTLRNRSRLTGDGFPFELAFSTTEPDQLRFTLDPQSRSEPGAGTGYFGDRLYRVRRLLGESGLATPDHPSVAMAADEVWAALDDLQRGKPLTYGVWVGARFCSRSASARVYAEVPAGAPLPAMFPPGPRFADHVALSCMVGFTPSTGALESYFRINSLEPEQLANVFAPVGLQQRARSTLEFVENIYGHRVRGRLPGASVGVSYTSHPAGHCVTLYFFARSLWGSDARIRRSFAQFGGPFGPNLKRYLAVSAPFASNESWKTYHGLVSISFSELRDEPALGIGLRPFATYTGLPAP